MLATEQVFPGFGACHGKIISSRMVASTVHPGEQRRAYKVSYNIDNQEQEFEEEELRPLLVVKDCSERVEIIKGLTPAFDYLEDRINGTCEHQYSCQTMYEVCKIVRAFDPAYAAKHLTPQKVDELAIITPVVEHVNLNQLKAELPAYMSAAAGTEMDTEDVKAYSDAVLEWWKSSPKQGMHAWRKAARIMFSITPNSASCERVFALLKNMFGSTQDACLADYIQASLMLRFNQRDVA
jgi:hypothetical protein